MRRLGLILAVVAIGLAIGGYVFFNGERKVPIRYRTAGRGSGCRGIDRECHRHD